GFFVNKDALEGKPVPRSWKDLLKREQSSGIAQINTSVSQLDGVTQQNATLVEEAAAAASVLAGQSEALKRAVAVFRA
ncbi:hypothetical protein ACQUWY_24245, partial [Ralstonia pseudosolanacearum]